MPAPSLLFEFSHHSLWKVNNAELARNPIWCHSIDASRATNRANGPPYEGVVLLVASCFF